MNKDRVFKSETGGGLIRRLPASLRKKVAKTTTVYQPRTPELLHLGSASGDRRRPFATDRDCRTAARRETLKVRQPEPVSFPCQESHHDRQGGTEVSSLARELGPCLRCARNPLVWRGCREGASGRAMPGIRSGHHRHSALRARGGLFRGPMSVMRKSVYHPPR